MDGQHKGLQVCFADKNTNLVGEIPNLSVNSNWLAHTPIHQSLAKMKKCKTFPNFAEVSLISN